jgi:guanylate kinase
MSGGALHWALPDRGVLFVVSGPSGVGKSTLVKAAMSRIPGLRFSVSATTRPPRQGERDGVDYHFVSPARFAELVAADAFLEHATVYDRSYGTLRDPTEAALASGASLLLDIDVQGSAQVRESKPDAVHVFVLPPSIAALEQRLRARGTDDEETIRRRMDQAMQQLRGCVRYDYVLVNDDLEASHAAFQGILLAETSRRERRESVIERVLGAQPAGA